MNIEESRALILKYLQEWRKDPKNSLVRRSFGGGNCCCPLSVVGKQAIVADPFHVPLDKATQLLGWTYEQGWSFIEGFDDWGTLPEVYDDEQRPFFLLGQEIAKAAEEMGFTIRPAMPATFPKDKSHESGRS